MRRWFPSPGLWALLLLLVVLGLQFLGGLYALEVSRISKESELEAHLGDLGRLAQSFLHDAALDLTDLALEATLSGSAPADDAPDPAYYERGMTADRTQPFIQFQQQARLEKIVLIDERGRMLFNTDSPSRLLEPFDFWQIDADEIRQARHGSAAASPAYEAEDDRFKRYYVPIGASPAGELADADRTSATIEQVPAVLVLVAGRDYLAQLGRQAQALRRAGLVLAALLLVIAGLIWSLLRRQRAMERQAADADRLAGLGTLAAGFAHELRNPLGIIRAFTEDLERGLRDGVSGRIDAREAAGEAAEVCGEIVEEVDRMNRLVGQFLSYTRGGDAAPGASARARVGEALQSALTMLRAMADKKQVGLELLLGDGYEADPPQLAAIEAGQLRQIVMNLVLNAIEAAPPQSTVRLRLDAGSGHVELSVSDEGAGVSEKDARRIFEPFFTTRSQGSGLGLAISRQLAQRAGGELTLAPRKKDQGATFILRLPTLKEG